jgi:hypothetical protein
MRITKLQVAMLKDALSSARLERCGCHADAKDAMRSFLETWVASRIEEVIEAVEATR